MSSKRSRNGTDTDLKRLQEEFEAEFSRPKVRFRLHTIQWVVAVHGRLLGC